MRMSTKGRYGLRVMIELAMHHGNGPLLVETIAKNLGISGKYIHALVGSLRSAGLVRTVRGPAGGYELARSPSAISALEIVAALEGGIAIVDCAAQAVSCERAGRCAARDVWCEVVLAMERVLSDYTLERLAAKQSSKEAVGLDFCI